MYSPEWLVFGVQSRTTSTWRSFSSSDDAVALPHAASSATDAARARTRVRMVLLGRGPLPGRGEPAQRVDDQEQDAGEHGDDDDGDEDLVDVVGLARALDEHA